MKEVSVNIYGGKPLFFKGKETPLEADVISCDKSEQCDFYKRGECFLVRTLFGNSCPFGSCSTKKGYTSRAQKYYEFKNKWTSHENYNKCKYPNKKIGKIGDFIVFPYSYININVNEEHVEITNTARNKNNLIPLHLFNVDLVYRLCTFNPRAFAGHIISDYQAKEVPLFLMHLKEEMPELYTEFVNKYTEFQTEINYVGRKALLKSLKPCVVEYISTSSSIYEKWEWDGENLTLLESSKAQMTVFIVKKSETVKVVIKPSEDAVVTITNNSQVDENTVFTN